MGPSFLHADSKDSDQTELMPRLAVLVTHSHSVDFLISWLNFSFLR